MSENKKVLLALLPFWNPLIPPMGIACLKGYLDGRGFDVKTVDANVENRFQNSMDRYFNRLKEVVPVEKQGNISNIGNHVLKSHLMAYINKKDEDERAFHDLVSELVFQTFFITLQPAQVVQLNHIIEDFFHHLRGYIEDLIREEQPDVLGLSTYDVTLPASLFAFRLVKEIDPGIQTVMGGGIFSGELDIQSPNFKYFVHHTPEIDKIIVGEGEELLYKFLCGELPLSQRIYTLADIDNRVMGLAQAPLPDFSGLETQFYPLMSSYTSRSCPFNCSFCSEKVLWGAYRKKSGRQIARELTELSRLYRTQLFLMSDSLLNPVADGLSDAVIQSGLSLYWDGYLRADEAVCDEDRTFQWRRGGFYRARLGIESGSPAILEAMGKKITPTQIKKALSSLASSGIKTTTYWVIGYPGETETDFQHTLDLIEEMKDDIYEADCNPFIYFLTGQVHSHRWAQENKSRLLYKPGYKEMLMIDTWVLDVPPSREETLHRLNRFVSHCKTLGIPNPYSLKEIHAADLRWQKLHPTAAPPMADFLTGKNSGILSINENIHLKKRVLGHSIAENENVNRDWGF